jgi:hypothetical protein
MDNKYMDNKEPVTIDATPTWVSILPILQGVIEDKAQSGMCAVNEWDQIKRAFKALDDVNEFRKMNPDGVNQLFSRQEWDIIKLALHVNFYSLEVQVHEIMGDSGVSILAEMRSQITPYGEADNNE